MTPVIKKGTPKTFAVVVDGHIVRVKADTIDERKIRDKTYTFELDGEVVGRFDSDAVRGWWLEEAD